MRDIHLKCCYDPKLEAEGHCINCNVPLCKTCVTYAELNEGICRACRRQKSFLKIYGTSRIIICGLGIVFLVVSLIWISPGNLMNGFVYGLLGVMGAVAINMLTLALMSRFLLSNLEPHQKVFVALARYSVSGNKVFFNQAIKAMKKVEDMFQYKDALFDQLVSILILQPFDLPNEWVEYLCENFIFTEQELLDGILEFGTDVFEENIFNQHHYQAIEPYIEVLKRTEKTELYNKLIDQILERLEKVDLKAVIQPPPVSFQGTQPQPVREEPSVVKDRAFLTELKLIDYELEEFLTKAKRKKDWKKISEIIEDYELPKVPKSTFEAARAMATQTQQTMKGPNGIPGTADDLGNPNKVKICAECGISFYKDHLSTYVFRDISVNVCSECLATLNKEGHREPRLLASIRKPEEYKKVVDDSKEDDN